MYPWKFVLINSADPNCRIELDAEFSPEESDHDAEENGYCDVWASDAAHAEALERLGYSVILVKKDLDNDE